MEGWSASWYPFFRAIVSNGASRTRTRSHNVSSIKVIKARSSIVSPYSPSELISIRICLQTRLALVKFLMTGCLFVDKLFRNWATNFAVLLFLFAKSLFIHAKARSGGKLRHKRHKNAKPKLIRMYSSNLFIHLSALTLCFRWNLNKLIQTMQHWRLSS